MTGAGRPVAERRVLEGRTGLGALRLEALTPVFPGMISQSAFILPQQAIRGQSLTTDACEVLDCVPVPVAHGARPFHPGWLADIARIGRGGNDRYFYRLHL